jgi:rhamnosyltransferase
MIHNKTAAYITAYQDVNALNQCISALEKQTIKLDIVYIIDNSLVSLQEKIYNKENLLIEHYPENIGIGRGLAIAINWAINNNYDFLWTFDQDSCPSLDTLEILLSEYEYLESQNITVGIISPTIIEAQTQQILPNDLKKNYRLKSYSPQLKPSPFSYYREKLYQCDVVITSGSLINLQAARQIPLANPDLFIDGVDWDYCLKLRQAGYHICVTQKTTMQHNFGTYLTHLNKQTPIYIYSPLRYYYINRNHTYIETRLFKNPFYITLSVLHRLKTLIKKLIKIILLEPDQKPLKLWASCLGFVHGLIGKLGKTWLN